MARRSRRSADDLLRDADGQPRLTPAYLKQLCKEMEQYTTPRLNDQLYLHFKGFPRIEALDEYTGLKCLWLEGNGLRKIENLENNTELRGLYAQQNCIETIENIGCLKELDALNVSNNLIKSISGLECNGKLQTLTMSHNKLKDSDSIRGLLNCPSLRIVDLSHNDLEDPSILEVFASMKNLRVLNLMGNKAIKGISQYRKTMIVRCKELTYLDDRPVFPKERAQSEAFFNGYKDFPPGREAERACRQDVIQAEKDKQMQGIRHLMEIQARARQRARDGIEGDADRTDSEEELEEENDDNKKADAMSGYEPWQTGSEQPNIFSQRDGKLPQGEWQPAPDPTEPIEVITGPKAADIALFDSEDEFDELDENTGDEPALIEVSTTRTNAAPVSTSKPRQRMLIEEISSDEDEEIPEELPVKSNKTTWHTIGSSGGDEVPSLERVDLASGSVVEIVSGDTDSSLTKPSTGPVAKKPLIEVIGGDDMDGLD